MADLQSAALACFCEKNGRFSETAPYLHQVEREVTGTPCELMREIDVIGSIWKKLPDSVRRAILTLVEPYE